MRARNVKIVMTIVILALFAVPAYFFSTMSREVVTGNAALNPDSIDHYDVYCAEEAFRETDGMEPTAVLNSSDDVPRKCLRMPTSYVVYVPRDSEGNQIGMPEHRLY